MVPGAPASKLFEIVLFGSFADTKCTIPEFTATGVAFYLGWKVEGALSTAMPLIPMKIAVTRAEFFLTERTKHSSILGS